jgi:hypothetical protein
VKVATPFTSVTAVLVVGEFWGFLTVNVTEAPCIGVNPDFTVAVMVRMDLREYDALSVDRVRLRAGL